MEAKLASKKGNDDKSIIQVGNAACGGKDLMIIGGPCTVESEAQMEAVANHLKHGPVQALRGGVYKPRGTENSFRHPPTS